MGLGELPLLSAVARSVPISVSERLVPPYAVEVALVVVWVVVDGAAAAVAATLLAAVVQAVDVVQFLAVVVLDAAIL